MLFAHAQIFCPLPLPTAAGMLQDFIPERFCSISAGMLYLHITQTYHMWTSIWGGFCEVSYLVIS